MVAPEPFVSASRVGRNVWTRSGGTAMVDRAPEVASGELYAGLREMFADSFPRSCRNCQRRFDSLDDWLEHTRPMARGSGLKQSFDEDDQVIVELFRNCVCGSTLMEACSDRRDQTPEGEGRRERFARLIELLVARGLSREDARLELLAARQGKLSERLRALLDAARGGMNRPDTER